MSNVFEHENNKLLGTCNYDLEEQRNLLNNLKIL